MNPCIAYQRLAACFGLSLIWAMGIQAADLRLCGFQELATPSAQDLSSVESRQLEEYLRRLGLDEIVIAHLENSLETTQDTDRRKRFAERLAAAYATYLLDNRANDTFIDGVEAGAKRLVRIYPELDVPLLRVAIFQAQYGKINLKFHEWWYAGRSPIGKQGLVDGLRELIDDLIQLTRRIESRRTELMVNAQFGRTKNRLEMENLENVLAHSHYLIGWSTYLRAIVQDEEQSQWLDMSELHFREFLQIEPEKILVELTPSWFDLESGWTSRGLIGLALCLQANGQPDASQKCFDLLAQANSANLTQVVPTWKLKSLLFDQQIQKALVLARSYAESSQTRDSEIGFWTTAARGGLALNVAPNNFAKQLIRLAFVKLVRNMQAETIRELVDKFNVRLPEDNFLGNWIAGYLLFVDAQSTAPGNYLQSRKRLETAIRVANETTERQDLARCRFLLGWIEFHDRHLEAAEKYFQEVVNELRILDTTIAAQAQWFRVQSLIEISRNSPRTKHEVFAAMDQMQRWFPDAAMTERIEFEKMKLDLRSMPDEAAVRRLQTISRGDVYYADALYERVLRQYRVWLKIRKLGREDAAPFKILSRWEREYRNHPESTVPRKLKTILLVVDSQLRRGSTEDNEAAGALLSLAQGFAQSLSDIESPVYVDYKYYCFLFAQADNRKEAKSLAEWLLQHAPGSRYETSALVFLAQQWNDRSLGEDATNAQLKRAVQVFTRLLEVSGESAESLSNSQNSRIATFQLAQLRGHLGDWDEADVLNQRLLSAFPDNPDYLLAAARVKLKLEQFESARAFWRKLAAGVEAGTEVWYESKFEFAVCVAKSDPTSALKLIRQIRQLSPNMPENWALKFEALESSLIKP